MTSATRSIVTSAAGSPSTPPNTPRNPYSGKEILRASPLGLSKPLV